ncbi:MAG TPA: hypothetical protein VG898_09360 [Solirubrobacterales bacterium]|nr:hypothetical protein [Solirubrobacterales bacterium]
MNRARTRDPLARRIAVAALILALAGTVFSMAGGVLAKPKHSSAKKAEKRFKRKLNARIAKLKIACPIPEAVDLGTWCLESSVHPIPPEDLGKNDYLYAAQTCVKAGGWLPSAAQLLGAAPRAKLQSTIDDNPVTSGADEFPDPKNGIKDGREMSSDLFTTTAGDAAAGSEGVTPGSKGNTSLGEPDPVPLPADPLPGTLDYVTVYDNHNLGGFAGGAPVGKAEKFRCAFAKGAQGRRFGD